MLFSLGSIFVGVDARPSIKFCTGGTHHTSRQALTFVRPPPYPLGEKHAGQFGCAAMVALEAGPSEKDIELRSAASLVSPRAVRKRVSNRRRRRSISACEMVRLDRAAAEPLHQQLYRQIRDELRSGSFIDGASRLPSSRALAADLGISRLT